MEFYLILSDLDAQQESYAEATNASSIYFFGINRLFERCYL